MCEAKTFKELMDAVFDLCEEKIEVNRTINIVGDLIVIDRPNEWKCQLPRPEGRGLKKPLVD